MKGGGKKECVHLLSKEYREGKGQSIVRNGGVISCFCGHGVVWGPVDLSISGRVGESLGAGANR